MQFFNIPQRSQFYENSHADFSRVYYHEATYRPTFGYIGVRLVKVYLSDYYMST